MGALSTWNLEGWRLEPVLAAGEQVLTLTPTTLPATEPVLTVARQGPPEKEPPLLRALDTAWSVVTLPLKPFTLATDAVLSAFSNDAPVSGGPGSTAHAVATAVGRRGDRLYLAVTNHRLLVLEGERLSQQEPFGVVAQLELAAVRGAEVRSKRLTLSFGRLRITFVDGSWLEFADGFAMGRRRAIQVRDAVVDGRVTISGEPRPPRS